MALTLMYITNNPLTAHIAQEAGVDRIWIDMEYIGKDERQGGMDTVRNHHTIDDIKNAPDCYECGTYGQSKSVTYGC